MRGTPGNNQVDGLRALLEQVAARALPPPNFAQVVNVAPIIGGPGATIFFSLTITVKGSGIFVATYAAQAELTGAAGHRIEFDFGGDGPTSPTSNYSPSVPVVADEFTNLWASCANTIIDPSGQVVGADVHYTLTLRPTVGVDSVAIATPNRASIYALEL